MRLLAPALIFCGAIPIAIGTSFGQSPQPQVPHKMHFAGMTLTIRDDARREIQADVDALTKSPKYFNIKAERAKTYFPIIERVFSEERLPDDFKYLSLQESALVPDAVSTSNAVGFWQFKDFTAKEMGIRVDKEVDERMNIASASRAAARYLKQCNHYFNNWVYALQAYQMGAGGVMRMVGDRDLGTRHMEITSETYWYVKKFLAHKVAFEEVSGKPSLEVVVLRDAGGKSFSDLSRDHSIEEEQLREYNKWLRGDRVPEDKEYVVLVPKGEATKGFGVLTVASAANATPPIKEFAPVEVKEINGIKVIQARKGETLASLVERADVSMSKFLSYNEMDIARPLVADAWYFLGKKKKHGDRDLYTVQNGEDIWTVSQQFGVRMKYLLKYNELELNPKSLAGTTLYLAYRKPASAGVTPDSVAVALNDGEQFEWDVTLAPVGNVEPPQQPDVEQEPLASVAKPTEVTSKTAYHEVKPADTLYSVARQYGVTIREIMEWNEKKDFSLAIGEKLRVAVR